jgi:hypothetical protein
VVRGLVAVGLAASLASCREDCVATCALPVAVIVHVTAGGVPGPVNGAFVRSLGPVAGPEGCVAEQPASICIVPGHAGTYDIEVGAPGFQTTRRTVVVQGAAAEGCLCPTADTVRIDVSLQRP